MPGKQPISGTEYQNWPRTLIIHDADLWDEFEKYAKRTNVSTEGAIMSALYAFMGEAR